MEDLKNNAWLLSIVAILLTIKFIFVPVFAWQNSKLTEVRLLTKKQQKINKVLANEADNQELDTQLTDIVNTGNQQLFSFQPESQFKLNQQKYLQSLLVQHNLQLDNIGFQSQINLPELNAVQYPVQIRFTGETEDAISFMASVESNEQRIGIDKYNVSFKYFGGESLGQINGAITLMLFVNSAPQKKTGDR